LLNYVEHITNYVQHISNTSGSLKCYYVKLRQIENHSRNSHILIIRHRFNSFICSQTHSKTATNLIVIIYTHL